MCLYRQNLKLKKLPALDLNHFTCFSFDNLLVFSNKMCAFKLLTEVPSCWFRWKWDLSQGRHQYPCTLWATYLSFKQTVTESKSWSHPRHWFCVLDPYLKNQYTDWISKLRTSNFNCYYLQDMEYTDVSILLQKIIFWGKSVIYFLAMFLVMAKIKISETILTLLKQIQTTVTILSWTIWYSTFTDHKWQSRTATQGWQKKLRLHLAPCWSMQFLHVVT